MSMRRIVLGDVVTPRAQKGMPKDYPDKEFVGLEHIQSHTGLLLGTSPSSAVRSAAAIVQSGDVIYGRLRPYLNKVHRASKDYLASGEFIVFPPSLEIDSNFLLHLLRSPEFLSFTAMLDTGDRPRVNWNGIKQFEFDLPPLDVQKRIVETLEGHLSRLDKALADIKQSRELLSTERRALLHSAFMGELHETSGPDRINELSRNWTPSTLGEVAKWGSGGTPKATRTDFYRGDIPWAVIGDLDDGLILDTEKHITEVAINESSAKLVPVGAILIAMYGSIGKLGIAGVEMTTNQAIAFAIPDEHVLLPKFLYWFLAGEREKFLKSGKGMTQQNISQTILKAWQIHLPPLDVQQRIVETLEDRLSRLDKTSQTLDIVEAKAQQLRRSLLHAAFTGQLTNEDAND